MTTLVYNAFVYSTSCAEKYFFKTYFAFDIQDCIIFHQHFYNFQVTMLGGSHEGSHSILNHECNVCVNTLEGEWYGCGTVNIKVFIKKDISHMVIIH